MQPLILDLDDSVGALPGALRVPLQPWRDRLRFACSHRQLREFGIHLQAVLPASERTVFFGSGDFHHLSLPLIRRACACGPLRVLVFDNHPDNMRFAYGIHCGSWVSHVAALPEVARVDVVGITSTDIGLAHAWENRLSPLYRGRLRYWSIGVDTGWARRIGLGDAFRGFDDAGTMMAALLHDLDRDPASVYLSIDKDVLDPLEARTNWDQGCLRVAHLQQAIAQVRPRLAGSDVNGEISLAHYPQRWKRMLSAADQQPLPDAALLASQQARQHAVNLELWRALSS